MDISKETVKQFLTELCEEDIDENCMQTSDAPKQRISLHKLTQPVSYDTFLQVGLIANQICLFSPWITKDWGARKNWSIERNGNVDPNFKEILKAAGKDAEVPVASISLVGNCQDKETWKLDDYISYWKKEQQKQDEDEDENSKFYLKDWHFCKQFPDYDLYQTPVFFTSDWLEEMWKEKLPPFDKDDFKFVYMGPKNSWTPFHADVYRSYSWSANICGKKKWIFYPPGTEKKLQDQNRHLPFDVRTVMEDSHCDVIEVIQEAGEVIFVPTGWHHQVHNLEDTISINHNWMNACNIRQVWKFFQSELSDVEKEISDCRQIMNDEEWFDQCQLIMKANTGMNYIEFYALLRNISTLRLTSLDVIITNNTSKTPEKSPTISQNTTIERQQTIREVLLNLNRSLENMERKSCHLFPIVIDLSCLLVVISDFITVVDAMLLGRRVVHKCGIVLDTKEMSGLFSNITCGLNRISHHFS